jgi:hypothetical protein
MYRYDENARAAGSRIVTISRTSGPSVLRIRRAASGWNR